MISSSIIPQEKKSLPKNLKPGNCKCRIVNIEMTNGFNPDSVRINLYLEGEPLGEDFEGFFIDRNDESKGRYTGQIGRVRLDQYDFETKTITTRKGEQTEIIKEIEIVKRLRALAAAYGLEEQFDQLQHPTLEGYVDLVKDLICNKGYIPFCLAGKEYEKGGYTNYDLFLPKGKNNKFAFGADEKNVLEFDPGAHIIRKKAAAVVEEFTPDPNNDFSFDDE